MKNIGFFILSIAAILVVDYAYFNGLIYFLEWIISFKAFIALVLFYLFGLMIIMYATGLAAAGMAFTTNLIGFKWLRWASALIGVIVIGSHSISAIYIAWHDMDCSQSKELITQIVITLAASGMLIYTPISFAIVQSKKFG